MNKKELDGNSADLLATSNHVFENKDDVCKDDSNCRYDKDKDKSENKMSQVSSPMQFPLQPQLQSHSQPNLPTVINKQSVVTNKEYNSHPNQNPICLPPYHSTQLQQYKQNQKARLKIKIRTKFIRVVTIKLQF